MDDITIRRPINWYSSADTNVGMIRKINEDSLMSNQDASLWAVADGMGGYEAGDIASNMIVSSLETIKKQQFLADFVDSVEDSLLDANHRIMEYSEIMHEGRMLGSTVVSLLIQGKIGICLWVGDSRLYRLRNDHFEQLSRDHSQVQELIDQGIITNEERENHPESNVITRAVGTSTELYIDSKIFDVRLGDTFLLCSDGLHNAVTEENIIHYMKQKNTDDSVKQLIVKALENGASDNVSVIIIKGVSDRE